MSVGFDESVRENGDFYNLTKEQLSSLIWSHSYRTIGKMFSLTDKTIASRCEHFQLEKPPQKLWVLVGAGKCEHPNGQPICKESFFKEVTLQNQLQRDFAELHDWYLDVKHLNLPLEWSDVSMSLLSTLVWYISMPNIATIYNISPRAVSRMCDRHGVIAPPALFWESVDKGLFPHPKGKAIDIVEYNNMMERVERERKELVAQRPWFYKAKESLNTDWKSIGVCELKKLVWMLPSEQVGELFGVSGRAVGKKCQRLKVPKPPVGFWARVHAGRIEHPGGRFLGGNVS